MFDADTNSINYTTIYYFNAKTFAADFDMGTYIHGRLVVYWSYNLIVLAW